MRTRIAAAIVAFTLTMTMTMTMSASANDSTAENIHGTLHFCAAGPCPPALTWSGQLGATGPFAGTAAVNVLSDRPNADFTQDQTTLSLSVLSTSGDESILIAMHTYITSPAPPAPCGFDPSSTCVYFSEDGPWNVVYGTGPYSHLHGSGTLHADGVAVNHSTGQDGYSDVHYTLIGRISPPHNPDD